MNSNGQEHMALPGADPELLGFVKRFFDLAGAVVETKGSGIDALVPRELQALLDAPEHIRIRGENAAGSPNDGCYAMGYGAPLLDRIIEIAFKKIPLLFCRLEFDYIKSDGFKRLLSDQLTFYGAVAEIETTAEVLTDYILVVCRYKALSDEQKEGIVQLVFNADTKRLIPDMAKAIDSAVCRIKFTKNTEDLETIVFSDLGKDIEKHAGRLLHHQLKSFRESMNRRFRRDINNLTEYYDSLKTEMVKRLESPTLSDNARKDRHVKIDELPAELARKTDDLFKKYSIKVRMNPAAARIIRTPVKKIICKLSIGRKNKRLFLTYNPVTRAIEPPACDRCDKNITHIHFSSNLELLCFECMGR